MENIEVEDKWNKFLEEFRNEIDQGTLSNDTGW